MVWTDTRDDGLPAGDPWYASIDMDCYGIWLDDTGAPMGDEIPISTGDDWQMSGVVSYNPVEKRFLIAWYDRQAININDTPFAEAPSAVRGTLYGVPSFLSGRITEAEEGTPVEDAWVIVMGPGMFKIERTNVGGWWNIPKKSQRMGNYLIITLKNGHTPGVKMVTYDGEPLKVTIESPRR
jgi:hypothetical protein